MMDDIVEQVKERNRIEDVIGETMPLQARHGRYLRCAEHDSLVVDTRTQTYSWNSRNEIRGDVIEWVMRRGNLDFKGAVEQLARRAKLPEPRWSRETEAQRAAMRMRQTAFQLALNKMMAWLWADAEALGYCRSRGWTDETIREAQLGFSGRATAAEYQEMRGEYQMYEIDPECPDAVAVLGYRGEVRAWAARWQAQLQENWVEWGMIPGLMGKTRLVYAHMVGNRVATFTARNILGAEINREGREVKSFNLPVALAGERQVYYNQAYAPRAEECVIVEGQADAVTLGQWGIPAAALAGTSWQDHAELLGELRKRHPKLYVGMDADEAGMRALTGRNNDWPLAKALGAGCRIITWKGE